MTFKLHSTDDGHLPAWEEMPAAAITPKVGLALYATSGKLAVASGANKPAYICMEERDAAVAAGEMIKVVKITPLQRWESEASASGAAALGTSYDVATDGLRVTKTTTNGGFIIDYADGSATGDMVRGRFDI